MEGGSKGGELAIPIEKENNVHHSTFTLPLYMYYSVNMYMYLYFHFPLP